MARTNQPKKYIQTVKLKDTEYGYPRRKSYGKTILNKETVFPKPLEYEDIDNEFFKFVSDELKMSINGKNIPTFTLYSNQRFSEYSQSWSHVDDDGNLLMNFKTVNRENNPKPGENQGGLWNIPGDQRYTLLIRDVLEDNGEESYEIYSMSQPYCVDLTYRISIITDIYENINYFNELINSKFKSRQCYIRPNGHFIPMVLEEINDNTEYTVSERKFYNQTVIIKAMAYIIKEEDFKVEKKPKRIKLFMQGDTKRPKPEINIDEYFKDKVGYKSIELTIDLKEYHNKVEFVIDTDFVIEKTELYNLRNIRLSVNDMPYYIDKGFQVKENDSIKIIVNHIDPSINSQIKFIGYNPNKTFINGEIPIDVKDEVDKYEDITIE